MVNRSLTFVFDRSGHLLEEADGSGTVQRDYIWLDNLPVAMVDDTGSSSAIYYIHTDQLDTPQKMSDGSANIVWDNLSDPFGNAQASQGTNWDAANWGSFNWAVTMLSLSNLRFPGQYFDGETGLNQNWHRDYDPSIGRYAQSDPLGVGGGPNTYLYALDRPTSVIDPTGLWGIGIAGGGSIEGGVVVVGAGATVGGGAGVFWGGSQGFNLGAYGGAGAFAGGPGYGLQYPAYPQGKNANDTGGAFVGAGAFLTNACSAAELKGPFDTYTFNIGVGPIQASIQIGVSGGTWIGSLTFGPGIGISGSTYPTNTWATGP